MMIRKGYSNNISVYLDDFLICCPTFNECCNALKDLLALVRKLGFAVNYKKLVDPTQCLIFLGVQLCSVTMSLSLPQDKLCLLKTELAQFSCRKRVSKRQLMHLNGLLNWAAGVVYGGRVYLRRLIQLCNSLNHKSDRVILSEDAKLDIQWWSIFLDRFNGKAACLDSVPVINVYTDASGQGGGGTFNNDWFYLNWQVDWPAVSFLHINNLEILAILLAAWRWAPMWEGKHVIILSDNTSAVAAINKGKCNNSIIMQGIRLLFWLSVDFNFKITAKHIAGSKNIAADAASRLMEPGKLEVLSSCIDISYAHLYCNMSIDSYNMFCRKR